MGGGVYLLHQPGDLYPLLPQVLPHDELMETRKSHRHSHRKKVLPEIYLTRLLSTKVSARKMIFCHFHIPSPPHVEGNSALLFKSFILQFWWFFLQNVWTFLQNLVMQIDVFVLVERFLFIY